MSGGSASLSVLNRLQHRSGSVVVLNAPEEFQPLLDTWRSEGVPVAQRRTPGCEFLLVFVGSRAGVERVAGSVVTTVGRDAVLWLAHPSPGSSRYRTDIVDDTDLGIFARFGFAPSRRIPLTQDWTAVRLSRIDQPARAGGH